MSDFQLSPGDSPFDDPPKRKRLDPLVRYMLVNWAYGMLAGVVCASALLIVDPFGLRPLIMRSDAWLAALFLLYTGFIVTFGGLVCAAAVMYPDGFGRKDDDEPRGGLRQHAAPRLAFAAAGARRGRG